MTSIGAGTATRLETALAKSNEFSIGTGVVHRAPSHEHNGVVYPVVEGDRDSWPAARFCMRIFRDSDSGLLATSVQPVDSDFIGTPLHGIGTRSTSIAAAETISPEPRHIKLVTLIGPDPLEAVLYGQTPDHELEVLETTYPMVLDILQTRVIAAVNKTYHAHLDAANAASRQTIADQASQAVAELIAPVLARL